MVSVNFFPIMESNIQKCVVFLQKQSTRKKGIKMSKVIKNRTKEEIIEALRKSLERKKEWEEQAQREFAEMRKNQVSISV
jgi:phytoene/squalene synthetase